MSTVMINQNIGRGMSVPQKQVKCFHKKKEKKVSSQVYHNNNACQRLNNLNDR